MKAGVLALQGDFREHAKAFAAAGATPIEVRTPEELLASSASRSPAENPPRSAKLAVSSGLVEPIVERANAGMPILGTCAGMIVMAKRVAGRAAARPHGHPVRPERVRSPGGFVRGRRRGPRAWTIPCAACSSARRWSRRSGTGCACSPSTTARRSCSSRGTSSWHRSTRARRRDPAARVPAREGVTCPAIRSGARSSGRRARPTPKRGQRCSRSSCARSRSRLARVGRRSKAT